MAYQRGDVLLVPFPFTDLSASKVRPGIVVSGERYHSTQPDLILAAITSQVAKASSPLDYILADWQAAGLRHPSAFKPVLFTLDRAKVIYRVGGLSVNDLAQVNQRLKQSLELEQEKAQESEQSKKDR